jgi:hypothetical protein
MIDPAWRSGEHREEDGVIVGSDQLQEWLLPWWWENFTKHNRFPVSFVDFGLSKEKKKWCLERGELIQLSIPDVFVKDKDEVTPETAAEWENYYGENFWLYRKTWFKKPLACLLSPYRRTIWIDLDCEVKKSLKKLFDACSNPSRCALVRDRFADQFASKCLFPIYHSGVVAFERGAPLIQEWAAQSLERNDEFRGDQDLLSKLIFEKGIAVREMPAIYNWNVGDGVHPKVVICHWLGEMGKAVLRNQIVLKEWEEISLRRGRFSNVGK